MVSNRPYVSVVKDLEKRRSALSAEMSRMAKEFDELEILIASLKKLMVSTAPPLMIGDDLSANPTRKPSTASMSMRWAILTIFGKMGAQAMSVSDVVEALKEMGFPDNMKLRGNASAVLSRMVGFKEVVNAGNSYTITDFGRHSLEAIKARKSIMLPHNNFTDSASAPEDEEEGD